MSATSCSDTCAFEWVATIKSRGRDWDRNRDAQNSQGSEAIAVFDKGGAYQGKVRAAI